MAGEERRELRREYFQNCVKFRHAVIYSFFLFFSFRTRIYFLSTPSNGWETTLLYVDIAHADHANGYRLHWQPVIEANFQRYDTVVD